MNDYSILGKGKSLGTRNEQKQQRQKQILAAGLDLFIQKGLAATKVSDIASAVGMSVGLLFHYFDSKERLYEELVKIGLNESQSALSANVADPISFFSNISKSILEKSDLFTIKMFVLMNQAANIDTLPEETRQRLRLGNIFRSADIIKAGQESGAIRSGEPIALSIAFWGAMLGVCQVIVQNPDAVRPKAEWLVTILKPEDSTI